MNIVVKVLLVIVLLLLGLHLIQMKMHHDYDEKIRKAHITEGNR